MHMHIGHANGDTRLTAIINLSSANRRSHWSGSKEGGEDMKLHGFLQCG